MESEAVSRKSFLADLDAGVVSVLHTMTEMLCKQVNMKMSILSTILGRLTEIDPTFAALTDTLGSIEDVHLLKTAHLFADEDNDKSKEEYLRLLSEEAIMDQLNAIALKCKTFIDTLTPLQQRQHKVKKLIDKYYSVNSFSADDLIHVRDYTLCNTCSVQMCNDYDNAELQCPQCGAVSRLMGTIYADNVATQDRARNRSGIFNPNRHFQFWWQHILAREPEEEIGTDDPDNHHGERTIAKLKNIIRRDRKILRLLTVNDIRKMLKEINETSLNKNVPLIMKKLTGIGPPNVSDELSQRIEKLFTKAIEIGEQKRRNNRINRNYYPYYIYKIVDSIIPEEDFDTKRILYYIYLQSDNTIVNDDKDWERICAELEDIRFVVTDKSKYLRFRPQ